MDVSRVDPTSTKTACTFGVFRDAATLWRARPFDVTPRFDAASPEIQLWFENRVASLCVRDEIHTEIGRYARSPLSVTLVVEPNGTLSCHLSTDPDAARRQREAELNILLPPGTPIRHVECPFRVPGLTEICPADRARLLSPGLPQRVSLAFHVRSHGPLENARFECESIRVAARATMLARETHEFPPVPPPGRFQEILGDYAGAARDEDIWSHAPKYMETCDGRSSGTMPEMDCARQLVELLRSRVRPGMSLLDAGCGAGHYYLSLRPLNLDYYGFDAFADGIRIGRRNLSAAGLHPARLQVRTIESMTQTEQYDIVVAFNVLPYVADFRSPLEKLAQSCRHLLVIRACFGDRTRVRWIPDILLQDGYQHLRMYQNIYARTDVQAFLAERRFDTTFIPDERQRTVWGGRPEIVGGIEVPYEILLARRRG